MIIMSKPERKTSRGKKEKKIRVYLLEENYLVDLQQEDYLNSWIRDMIRNIGQDWKEIGGDGREDESEAKEQ